MNLGAYDVYQKDVMKLQAKTDFLAHEDACHVKTPTAAFNMTSIANGSGGSDPNNHEELFYFKDDNGGELLINFCNAPIKLESDLDVMHTVSAELK